MVVKWLSWLAAALLVICLSACNADSATEAATDAPDPTTEVTETEATEVAEVTETDEPTDAPTDAPTAEPTDAPTEAAAPQSEAMAAITLDQDDLPDGFEPLILGQGIAAADVIPSDFPIGGAAAFTNASNGEVVISYWVTLDDEAAQQRFDTYISDELAMTEMIQLALLTGMGDIALSFDEPQPVEGLGDQARTAVMAGEAATQELVAFRRGSIGVFVLHVYPNGQAPLITTDELTQMLDERVQAALAES